MSKFVLLLKKLYYNFQIRKDSVKGLDFFDNENFKEDNYDSSISVHYEPSRTGFELIFKGLQITPHDSLIDIGCGKGKAIVMLSKLPFGAVDGYDISEELCEVAKRNIANLGIRNSHIFCANALEFDEYDKYTYFYLYNPVPEAVFEVVFDNILKSVNRVARKIHIININPKYSHIILRNKEFKLVNELKSYVFKYVAHHYSNEIK